MSDERGRRVTYECAVGHTISRQELDALTAVWRLDEGAEVQVCLEHGAPIAIHVIPERTQPAEPQP